MLCQVVVARVFATNSGVDRLYYNMKNNKCKQRGGGGGCRSADFERETEGAAHARLAREEQLAVMQMEQLLGAIEPQARAGVLAHERLAQRAPEWLPDLFQIFRAETDAVVGGAEEDVRTERLGGHADHAAEGR